MISSPTGVKVRRSLGIGPAPVANHEMDRIPVAGEVVVYFSDVPNRSYQLEQWLPALENLNKVHPVVLVFRKVPAMRQFRSLTTLPKIFLRKYDDLVNFYKFNDFKVCLYVNNGVANFQSLSAPDLVHVHVNHGESDKLSMVSNQAKGYDKTFVAGPAAIERHKAALIDFNLDSLVKVGRPQLDSSFTSPLAAFAGRTVMYAPTWEGENDANNYTSLDMFGEQIVSTLVSLPNTRVIYKPHPRISTTTNKDMAAAHARVVEILGSNQVAGVKHIVDDSSNILDLFEGVDALVTDVSSVGLDFLYLHPECPLILTDRRDKMGLLHREVPVSRCCPVISKSTAGELLPALSNHFDGAEHLEERREMRSFYFDEFEKGQSTTAFISVISDLIADRRSKLAAKGRG
ncbi:CDP-glycerol glycerophosphotransferase family protein [Paeniglutamicibacter sp. R2-26]|uniref:CDP-glycerol glycerophosphotransferase family protein n=1 Tax=Paeniglutamicibacter sp. R2-26 TaxID=3144417 RepID=UPI003EE69C3F